MTSNEQADELELLLDRSFTYGSAGYEDYELSSFLTNAQNYFVKQQYDKLNNRKQQGFEETEVHNQNIAELIKWFNCPVSSNQSGILTNGKFFDLPSDLMYVIYEETITDKIDCDDNPFVIEVKPVAHHEVNRFKYNKYKKPKSNGLEPIVWRLQFSRSTDTSTSTGTPKRHQLITDGTFNVNSYRISYLKNPPEIIVDRTTISNQRNCILDESTHLVIINIARDLALETVKEQRLTNKPSIDTLE